MQMRHKNVLVVWAHPALLCALRRFTQAPYIQRSGAKWAGAGCGFDVLW